MQVVALDEPLDGGDLVALVHHGERRAGIYTTESLTHWGVPKAAQV